jgi:hypothetical protein
MVVEYPSLTVPPGSEPVVIDRDARTGPTTGPGTGATAGAPIGPTTSHVCDPSDPSEEIDQPCDWTSTSFCPSGIAASL